MNDNKKKPPVNLIPAGVGTVLSSMVIAGFILGYLTDYLFDTAPIFLLIFGFMGFAGGMIRVKEIVTADTKKPTKNTSDKNGRDGGI